jgi:hypothetical protein
MAGPVPAIHTHRLAWVFMGRRDKPGDDGKKSYIQTKSIACHFA